MSDQLPTRLREVFETTAADADVPVLPFPDVLARGRDLQRVRRRRAAIWTAAGAAVAVVAVSLPLALANHGTDDSPAPAHRTTSPTAPPDTSPTVPPDTSPTTLPHLAGHEPHVDGTTLYADGRTFEVGKRVNLATAGTTVLVGHWSRHDITWQILRGGRLVPLPYGEGGVPVLSPAGRLAAVSTYPSPQTSRITVYDVATDAVVGHLDLDLPATCCDGGSVQELSIDSGGTVHWVEDRGPGPAPAMSWRPGQAPVSEGNVSLSGP